MKKFCALFILSSAHLLGWAANEIVIGQTADFSSVAGGQMKDFNAGALAYLSKVNTAGGIKGRAIKLVTLDDAFSADKAAQNAVQLIGPTGAIALFGSRGTDPTEAVMKVADSKRVPLIAPVTGADTVRKSRFTFPVRAGYRTEVEGILRHISFVPTRLAVLVQKDKFGLPLATFIEERLAKEYSSVVLVKKVEFERKSVDLKSQAADVLSSNPNAVIALCNPSSCEAFAKELLIQTRQVRRARPTIYQTSISDIYAQYKKLGAEIVQGNPYGQVLPDPHRTLSPLTKEYLALAATTKVPVNYRTFEGFISAKVLVTALSRAKSLTPEGVAEALEAFGTLDLGGLTVRYSGDEHQGSKYFDLVTLDRDGRLVH